MRVRLGLAVGFLAATSLQAQSSRYRPLPVRSCPYADSLLGSLKDDARGAVRGFYDEQRDSSYFMTGTAGPKPADITSSATFAGAGPVRDLSIQITAFVRGADREIVEATSRNGPVRAVFVLNDSVTVYPASTTLGRSGGEAKLMAQTASVVLAGADLLRVARARRIVMRVGPIALLLTTERPELRALIRTVVCPR